MALLQDLEAFPTRTRHSPGSPTTWTYMENLQMKDADQRPETPKLAPLSVKKL